MKYLKLVLLIIASAASAIAAEPEPTPADARPPITILSIVPAQGEPSRSISLYGGGFTEDTKVFLGSAEIAPEQVDDKQISFLIPDLQPGLYALYLKSGNATSSKAYTFTVVAPRPSITELSSDRIVSCAVGQAREVTISGKYFSAGARVLFDGAVVKSSKTSDTDLTFTVPAVPGGLHQVQVKNPDETVSDVQALIIDAKPDIVSVIRGEEHVNTYELIIDGINFQQGSAVMVDGRRVSPIPGAIDRERVHFVDCTRLIYERRPTDPVPQPFRIQIVNPNGDESPAVQVTAP